MNLHNSYLIEDGMDDRESLEFWRDLQSVMDAVHQGMSIVGPWMEARVKMMVRGWIPEGWQVSGPSQVYFPNRPELRSRSWDLIVHRSPAEKLPPAASPESGLPLVPGTIVAAVIDTKTNFSDPVLYARQPVFNLMNDATESQLDFLGHRIAKIVLAAASSSRSPESMFAAGQSCGLAVFSLARYKASPVSDGATRKSGWRLERYRDGFYPLQRFKKSIFDAIENAGSQGSIEAEPLSYG